MNAKKFKRVFVIIMDSVGAGEAPDSYKYNDQGANTLKHASYSKNNFNVDLLAKMGIGNITDINNTKPVDKPIASFGKMQEISVGKDTLTGHWEIMGLEVKHPFPSFTDHGFPKELIEELEKKSGHKFIGNYAASGTEIIKVLGEEHMKTKALIVYTSADSVLQIAANEQICPIDELYRVCQIARDITLDHKEWMVGRIIARPFIGDKPENFVRTTNRHDYAVSPFGKTVLENLKDNNYDVIAVGKINDIFNGVGITESYKTKSNANGMDITTEIAKKDFNGLCFVNLVDFDSMYGHRRNPIGYATCIEEFNNKLKDLINYLTDDDLLILTADHGNDPIHPGTDHTREYVPLIAYSKAITEPNNLGIRKTFADISATIAENFNIDKTNIGTSFLKELKK